MSEGSRSEKSVEEDLVTSGRKIDQKTRNIK